MFLALIPERKECIKKLALKGLRESFLYDNEYIDSKIYGLLKSDYFKAKFDACNETT